MPLEHVKIATVVRRFGLTSGAAYRIWTRQEDFHRDLALRVTRTTEGPAAYAVSAATLAAMESGAPFEEGRAPRRARAVQGHHVREQPLLRRPRPDGGRPQR